MNGTMQGRVCVVTGANAGIGRVTAEELARQGATVVMLCRSPERGEAARKQIIEKTGNQGVELVIADLASQAQVRRAAGEILSRHPQLHVLVNNAAVFLPRREETEDGLEKTFATNYLSHFLLTHLLLDALKAGAPSRVVNVATLTRGLKIDFDDLMLKRKYSVFGAVGPTKLGLILFTQELAKRLEGSGVTVNALHPGLVKTELLSQVSPLMRGFFHLLSAPPAKGARTSIYLATSPEVAGVTGKLFAKCKPVALTGQAREPEVASRLWSVSMALAKLETAPSRP